MLMMNRRANKMTFDDRLVYGIVGTVVSATGAGLSVNEIQAIVSMVVTIAGFIIGVLVPVILKIVKKIREAKEDGVITDEEKKEIIDTISDGAQEIKDNLPKEDKEKK